MPVLALSDLLLAVDHYWSKRDLGAIMFEHNLRTAVGTNSERGLHFHRCSWWSDRRVLLSVEPHSGGEAWFGESSWYPVISIEWPC